MAETDKLVWDQDGERLYETGVKNGVLYPFDDDSKTYKGGVAWNGLSSVSESPSGAEANAIYADDMKYLNLYSAEELGLSMEAYMYPKEFEACDGSKTVNGVNIGQQSRKMFGLSYRTAIGNDVDGDSHAYKLHLVYGCKASPSERAYATINDSPEAITFSWELTTTPVKFESSAYAEYKPTSLLTIASNAVNTEAYKTKFAALEAILYGAETFDTYAASTAYKKGTYLAYENTGEEDELESGLYVVTTDIPSTETSMPAGSVQYITDNTELKRLPKPEEVLSIMAVG